MKVLLAVFLAASIGTAIGCKTVPYFDGEAELVAPSHVLATPLSSNTAGLASRPMPAYAESLADCARGRGEATVLVPREDHWKGRKIVIACADLQLTDPDALRLEYDGDGYASGSGPIVPNKKPLTASETFWGYRRLVRGDLVTYFVRYNDTHIRLVRWSSGNRWGNEIDHTYSVEVSPAGARVATLRSEARLAALELFPEW